MPNDAASTPVADEPARGWRALFPPAQWNTGHVRDELRRLVATSGEGLRLGVWDLSTSPYVDIAGARLLGEMQRELAARGVALRIVDARASVRDLIRKEGGMSVGEISRRVSIDDAVMARD